MSVLSSEVPVLIEGGLGVDDRGEVGFVNNFDFAGVKRFYVVTNHRAGFVRAWHAHAREAKYVTVLNGAAVVGAVKIDNFESPAADLPVGRWTLSSKRPAVLFIPAGYANGFMSLTADARLMFFSTSTLDDSRGDDIRYPASHWDIWHVEAR